jgi:hypothetical protein
MRSREERRDRAWLDIAGTIAAILFLLFAYVALEKPSIDGLTLWDVFVCLLAFLIPLALWLWVILLFRHWNFYPYGRRRKPLRGPTDSIRSEEIRYHNTAIYRDFEFFYKVTLGIIAGTAVLATGPGRNAPTTTFFLKSAGLLQLFSGVLFSALVVAHQKSKIERWDDHFQWRELVLWQESWMVVSMISVSSIFNFVVVPKLIQRLCPPSMT